MDDALPAVFPTGTILRSIVGVGANRTYLSTIKSFPIACHAIASNSLDCDRDHASRHQCCSRASSKLPFGKDKVT